MRKGSRSGCKSASHQLFKDKAKNRVDDLQSVFSNLQFARKESRTGDVAILEEQVHQMLREWKAELNESSPASSLHVITPSVGGLLLLFVLNSKQEKRFFQNFNYFYIIFLISGWMPRDAARRSLIFHRIYDDSCSLVRRKMMLLVSCPSCLP